jgi:hypothetical protein
MLDLTTPLGGLNIKTGSLYGTAISNRVQNKLQNSVLKIDTNTSATGNGTGKAEEASGSKGALARNFATSLLANLVAADRLAEERDRTPTIPIFLFNYSIIAD